MKTFMVEDEVSGQNCYFSLFDPYIQLLQNLTYIEVRRRLVCLSLMYDHIFTSLSHIMASSISTGILIKDAELLKSGIVIPYMRQFTSVEKAVDAKLLNYEENASIYGSFTLNLPLLNYKSQLFNTVPDPDFKDIDAIAERKVNFLSRNIIMALSHSPSSGMSTFKNALLLDLDPHSSRFSEYLLLNQKFSEKLREYISIHVEDRMNRDLYFSLVKSNVNDDLSKNAFNKIMLYNYITGYLSNLNWKADVVAPWYLADYAQKLPIHTKTLVNKFIITETRSKALLELIEASKLPGEIIDNLTDLDIIEIRSSRELKMFREAVSQLYLLLSEPIGSSRAEQHAFTEALIRSEEVRDQIRHRARMEAKLLSRGQKFKRRLYSLLDSLGLGFAHWLTDPFFNYYLSTTGMYDFALLAQKIKDAADYNISDTDK